MSEIERNMYEFLSQKSRQKSTKAHAEIKIKIKDRYTHLYHNSDPSSQGDTRRNIHQSDCGMTWHSHMACPHIHWHL